MLPTILLILVLSIILIPIIIGLCSLLLTCHKKGDRDSAAGLLFHAITSHPCSHFSYYPTDKFRRFIESLDQTHLMPCTLSEAFAPTDGRRRLAITFDDGLLSFFTDAYPVLERYSVKTTIFIVAGFIGRYSAWDVLPKQAHLNKDQIREIAGNGHEIGSHSMTHPKLTFLCDADLRRELCDSKKQIEDIIGKPVTSISFPFGAWNERIWEKALEAGYAHATCFFRRKQLPEGLLPLRGIYSFDAIEDVFDKTRPEPKRLISFSRSRIMPHFAKGTPLWKFRKNYAVNPS
jgi:peptidoglycan/xylan/chitin deacetylase (PgdA/CDA1 family)